jgi:hypothetical protein
MVNCSVVNRGGRSKAGKSITLFTSRKHINGAVFCWCAVGRFLSLPSFYSVPYSYYFSLSVACNSENQETMSAPRTNILAALDLICRIKPINDVITSRNKRKINIFSKASVYLSPLAIYICIYLSLLFLIYILSLPIYIYYYLL